MVVVEVCVGSSCHLKRAPEIAALLEKAIKDNALEDSIVLCGSFCAGKCNRVGVTITVNDTIYTGITPETFPAFWRDTILKAVENERK